MPRVVYIFRLVFVDVIVSVGYQRQGNVNDRQGTSINDRRADDSTVVYGENGSNSVHRRIRRNVILGVIFLIISVIVYISRRSKLDIWFWNLFTIYFWMMGEWILEDNFLKYDLIRVKE